MSTEERPWREDVDELIVYLSEGDAVEFEYRNMQRNTSRKRAEVVGVNQGRWGSIMVDAGGRSPWKITGMGSVSVSYDHDRDGEQTRHLGRVSRIRRVDDSR